jgi:hypothetical protein
MTTTIPHSVTPFTYLTGTIVAANPGGKPPTAANGITAVFNGQLQTLASSTPGAMWRNSTTPPVSPMGICGDMSNGVVIFNTTSSISGSTDTTTSVAYALTGVGVAGASWSKLPPLPVDEGCSTPAIEAICGDLYNGLVVSSGKYVYAMSFTSYPREWTKIGQTPHNITAIAGDPTNGILIATDPTNSDGTSSNTTVLYVNNASCPCTLAPLTGGSLPVARIRVSQMCGSLKNGFILYGENQLMQLTVTAATATAGPSGTQTMLSPLPFSIVAMTGDPVNGMAVIAVPNDGSNAGTSGTLLASCAPSTTALASSWNVVTLQDQPLA